MYESIHVRITKEQYEWLRQHCFESRTSQAEVVREALDIFKNQKEVTQVTYEQMVDEARRRALYSGTFTDDPEEKVDDVYLVKDIDLVVKAFLKDIEEGDTAEYSEPAEFLDKHGIEWE